MIVWGNVIASERAATLIAAVEQFYAKHGRYPERLDEIVPGFIAEIPRAKLREAIRSHAEQARLSKRLAEIRTDLALPWSLADLARREPDNGLVLDLCRELTLTRLAGQFAQPAGW